ncbi:MAG TPA: hypothetical protein ENJ51_12845 [Leucothrix mucor]|uniref:histidine kinase n=1 Tax=Leucothrix mucor TaxID=45248 RepID=A0A7V2T221_LEUMU|nr:hypothetical protein [Leucothrix mucor]
MKLHNIISKIGLLGTFALFSFVSIVSISVISGVIFFNFIQNNLLQRELEISSEFIQSVFLFKDPEAYIKGSTTPREKQDIQDFFRHITDIPDVFKVIIYNNKNKIIWANNPEIVGRIYTQNDELGQAYQGKPVFSIVNAKDRLENHNRYLPKGVVQFIEGYLPIWDKEHAQVIGAIELYKAPRALFETINKGRMLVIAVSILAGLFLFGLLYWIVHTAHKLIESQKRRIKLASSRAVELNERNLRRIGSELHDGPAQSLGFALLKLDSIIEDESDSDTSSKLNKKEMTVDKIRMALQDALQEIRSLSAGLVIPDLNDLCTDSAIQKVIDRHEKRTSSKVQRHLVELPPTLGISSKICIYRFIQEGLNNAFRHGQGIEQSVNIKIHNLHVIIKVRDGGPGMKDTDIDNDTEHLGLQGLRERVESLGGAFRILNNKISSGVTLIAILPI